MLKIVNNSFKKKIAILACAAFISLSFPGAAHTATKSSSKEFLNPEKLFSLIPPLLSLVSHDFSLGLYDSAAAYCLSEKDKKPPAEEKKDKPKQKSKDSYDKNDNSTSKKKANGKD